MKEVTYEEWQKNPIPRMMWVWNSTVECKVKRMVLFLTERNPSHPVVVLTSDNITCANYKHCAEIEKPRRMTYKELSRWLREKPTRECKWTFDGSICSVHTYNEKVENEEVHKDVRIREDDGEWKEPLVNCSMAKQERLTEARQEIKEMRNRIAELEKENAELKSEFGMLKTSEY